MKGKHFQTRNRGLIAGALAVAILTALCGAIGATEREELLQRAFEKGLGKSDGELAIDSFGANLVLTGRSSKSEHLVQLDCLMCTTPEAVAKAREAGVLLSREAGGQAPAHLVILSLDNSTSTASIDGFSGILGNPGQALEPGTHEVEVRSGGVTAHRKVDIAPGKKRVLNLEDELEKPRPTSLRVPAIFTGLGLALAAFSVPFLTLDGGCASSTEDTNGNCRDIHDTSTLGWSLLGTGVAVALAGTITLIAMKAKQRKAILGQEVNP